MVWYAQMSRSEQIEKVLHDESIARVLRWPF